MAQQQQIIPKDSAVKQTVRKDSSSDSLKKSAVVKADIAKPKQAGETAAVIDTIPKQDTIIAGVPVVSLFTSHELKPANGIPLSKTDSYSGWITALLLGCAVIIAYLKAAYSKRFVEFFRAVLDMRFASQLVREEKVLSQRVSVFLMLIFFLSSTAFVFILNQYFNAQLFSGNDFLVFCKIGVSIFLLFILRIFILELTGFIFNAQNEFSFYSFHVFLFNKALGLALIPVLVCIVYATALPQTFFIYTGIILFAISYATRLIRGLNIGLGKQGFNKLYLFFYFCTLEILPAVFLAKVILKHTA
ncbi:MAG: DUF4271 domain-containing protein [Bacteroidia bacterium]